MRKSRDTPCKGNVLPGRFHRRRVGPPPVPAPSAAATVSASCGEDVTMLNFLKERDILSWASTFGYTKVYTVPILYFLINFYCVYSHMQVFYSLQYYIQCYQ